MNSPSQTYQVAIVGGGPVGLFLGLCLEQADISFIILEKRTAPKPGSRSLGIHPVSLELFDELGIANSFLNQGAKIEQGHAFANTKKLGTLSFDDCPNPFNFILAHPQNQTEHLLEQSLINRNPFCLRRDVEVTQITEQQDHVRILFQDGGITSNIKTKFLVGCDGKNSLVRRQSNISYEGKQYPDTYIMGDSTDHTDFGNDAAIFLCDEGLIESFPLPDNNRRWVVKTSSYLPEVNPHDITDRVKHRIGTNFNETDFSMLSSFGVQKFIASPMAKNRIILCGDAAHVVSPIGGQGMNLGWLAAKDLANTLAHILQQDQSISNLLTLYQQRRTHAAQNAIRRAEINMWLGRQTSFPALRNSIVSIMLKKPFSNFMANIFTMRGLERWPF
ncbi:NAD(P)/FAD-dependent oxidoreductase [Fodinibius sp. Rm-B-1B1-1]|uniref:NAD(P)/FAD-dependent oxidoreductase n=1 Tax=Fodinibius alkaliphilus TaxID=3140241 RepID=UPI00315AF016